MNAPEQAVVLAGGTGTRLFPTTRAVNKHLLPVYDQPLLLLVLEQLVRWGIREVTLVVNPVDRTAFERLLDGVRPARFERIDFLEQRKPAGVAEPLRLLNPGDFRERFLYVLGDNLLAGPGVDTAVQALMAQPKAGILGVPSHDLRRYGVACFDTAGRLERIVEKPRGEVNGLAIPGLYLLDHDAFSIAEEADVSERGELEITAILDAYRAAGCLELAEVGDDHVWFDIASAEDLFRAAEWRRELVRSQEG